MTQGDTLETVMNVVLLIAGLALIAWTAWTTRPGSEQGGHPILFVSAGLVLIVFGGFGHRLTSFDAGGLFEVELAEASLVDKANASFSVAAIESAITNQLQDSGTAPPHAEVPLEQTSEQPGLLDAGQYGPLDWNALHQDTTLTVSKVKVPDVTLHELSEELAREAKALRYETPPALAAGTVGLGDVFHYRDGQVEVVDQLLGDVRDRVEIRRIDDTADRGLSSVVIQEHFILRAPLNEVIEKRARSYARLDTAVFIVSAVLEAALDGPNLGDTSEPIVIGVRAVRLTTSEKQRRR